jgi:hypothetical protein
MQIREYKKVTIFNLIPILITISFTSALTIPIMPTTKIIPRGGLPGSCPSKNYPTEEMFVRGYNQFCDSTLPSDRQNALSRGTPVVLTLDLSNADNSISHWVYKISVEADSPNSPSTSNINLDAGMCKSQFQKFLDTDEAGGLGGSYCVVDGTGGDKVGVEGMSDEGVVSVLGGKTVIKDLGQLKLARLEFASYRRHEGSGNDDKKGGGG